MNKEIMITFLRKAERFEQKKNLLIGKVFLLALWIASAGLALALILQFVKF